MSVRKSISHVQRLALCHFKVCTWTSRRASFHPEPQSGSSSLPHLSGSRTVAKAGIFGSSTVEGARRAEPTRLRAADKRGLGRCACQEKNANKRAAEEAVVIGIAQST